ncbi:MAG: aminotransferase class V-fold PLP-dependent enzyme [Pseudomonadota bacterium]
MAKQRIYLDHAATSPLRPEARAAMEEGFALWANPSSPHAEGRKAKQALEDARDRIKRALKWDGEVIFTSGASEALWIALNRAKVDRRIVSAVEHDAVFRAAPDAEVVPIGKRAAVDPDKLFDMLKGDGHALVAVQDVNSETGNIQPVSKLAPAIREMGGIVLSDCSQSAGKSPLPDADMMVVSSHKFGGPIGIGALLVRDLALLDPMGGHERGYRPGTENLPAVLGMAAALEKWTSERDGQYSEIVQALMDVDDTAVEIGGSFITGAQFFEGGPSSTFISAISHPTMSAQALLIRLDAAGFAVSAGSACSSGTLKKSRVLDAFGVPDDVAARTIRVSMGWSTTPEELNAFAEAWRSLT